MFVRWENSIQISGTSTPSRSRQMICNGRLRARGRNSNGSAATESGTPGYNPYLAPVAQLDRVLGYEPRGRGFKSCRARQSKEGVAMSQPLLHFRHVAES